jgi:hypothetical protein
MRLLGNAVLVLLGGLMLCPACKKEDEPLDFITFEELALDPATGYWNGSGGEEGFESGNAWFPVYWDDTWGEYWEGFAYTNHSSPGTPGIGNQYSSYTGSGAGRSRQYAVFYSGFYGTDTLSFRVPERLKSLAVSNTAYAALAMRDGDGFTKKFGGGDGLDPDWFSLVIEGISPEGELRGTIQVYLADFRAEGSENDYISNGWTTVPLDMLGVVGKLVFSFASSDTTAGWINVPTYVCVDNIIGRLE